MINNNNPGENPGVAGPDVSEFLRDTIAAKDGSLPYRSLHVTADNDDLDTLVHVESVTGADMNNGERRRTEDYVDEDTVILDFPATPQPINGAVYTHAKCSIAESSCEFLPDTDDATDLAGRRRLGWYFWFKITIPLPSC